MEGLAAGIGSGVLAFKSFAYVSILGYLGMAGAGIYAAYFTDVIEITGNVECE